MYYYFYNEKINKNTQEIISFSFFHITSYNFKFKCRISYTFRTFKIKSTGSSTS